MVHEMRHLKTGDPEPTFPDDGKLQLFSMRFCPYAQRAHLVLEAKKIPYHTYNINLVNKLEWFFKYSPSGQTPALGLTNEKENPFIGESLIVADYLDEKYPERKLYPEDPLAKANDRLFLERFNKVITATYIAAGIMSGTGALKEIADGLDEFEAELKKRNTKFFGGDQPGMLDYMIWPGFERIVSLKYNVDDRFEMDNERYAKLVEWSTNMIADPAVSVYYLAGDIHLKYIQSRIAKNIDYDMLIGDSMLRGRVYELVQKVNGCIRSEKDVLWTSVVEDGSIVY